MGTSCHLLPSGSEAGGVIAAATRHSGPRRPVEPNAVVELPSAQISSPAGAHDHAPPVGAAIALRTARSSPSYVPSRPATAIRRSPPLSANATGSRRRSVACYPAPPSARTTSDAS